MTAPPTLRDQAIDAAAQALNTGRYWLPADAQAAIVDAVLAVRDTYLNNSRRMSREQHTQLAELYMTTKKQAEKHERRAIRIQTLLDEQRDRVRKLADQIALDGAWGRSTADKIRTVLQPPKETA